MPVHLTCPTCGTAFTRNPSQIRARNSCSKACAVRMTHVPIAYTDDGTAALIPLYARDGTVERFTLVDAFDAERVSKWTWRFGSGYARRGARINGRFQTIRLHRELLGMMEGDQREVDHINRDTLDNRRCNLRIVTHRENGQNLPSFGRTSAHRGVSWNKARRKWQVAMSVNKRIVYGGLYESEEEAAAAALTMRLRLMPGAVD